MLRINRMECDDGTVRLKLEGRLVGAWVGLLEQACSTYRPDQGARMVLDLSDVASADREGWQLLAGLDARGVCCSGWPPYLKALWLSTREQSRTDQS